MTASPRFRLRILPLSFILVLEDLAWIQLELARLRHFEHEFGRCKTDQTAENRDGCIRLAEVFHPQERLERRRAAGADGITQDEGEENEDGHVDQYGSRGLEKGMGAVSADGLLIKRLDLS